MTAILELHNVDAAYGPTQILEAVDLAVEVCGITTLLGANGAGKTTTLRAICNMIMRTSGEIRFAGERIDGKATEAIVRRGVAHVPDGRGTFLDLTVEENLRIGAYTRRDKGIAADFDRLYGYFPWLKAHLLFNFVARTASALDLQPFCISCVAIHCELIA